MLLTVQFNSESEIYFWLVLASLRRYRSTLLLVLGSSFIVQFFTLANPLLIQVLSIRLFQKKSRHPPSAWNCIVVVMILEGLLTSLRTFMFTDTTNRIDMRLGSEVNITFTITNCYFDQRPVGELGTRIAELEKIRNFLV